jgi:threonine/homoserine/homoserine lactone efflux protein
MIDASRLLFVVASLVLIVTPGQDMVLVMSRSAAQNPTLSVFVLGLAFEKRNVG